MARSNQPEFNYYGNKSVVSSWLSVRPHSPRHTGNKAHTTILHPRFENGRQAMAMRRCHVVVLLRWLVLAGTHTAAHWRLDYHAARCSTTADSQTMSQQQPGAQEQERRNARPRVHRPHEQCMPDLDPSAVYGRARVSESPSFIPHQHYNT